MKKALTFALAFSCLALWLSQSSFAQGSVTRTVGSLAAESGNREQDRLNGPVRRVRVETARIVPKNGNWVEGPREVLGITTYDPAGRKIDSVVYPVDRNTLSGQEQYLYDHKGNVVEMILRSADGSILSKESYKYEFDQLGNWTKMSSSVAVYENGKVIFEPTGITYRTISYYYNQAIEKLKATSPEPRGVSAPIILSRPLPNSIATSTDSSRPANPGTAAATTTQPPADVANARAKTELVTAPASVSPAKNSTSVPESPVATSSEIRTTPDEGPASSVVQHVTEEDLRNAAIELPQPEYSDAAMHAQASGRVRVQILVDETGQVTTAQATSGHPLLGAAAEAAARKARFSLAKVSSGATRVYGVISYDFVAPSPTSGAAAVTSPPIARTPPPQPVERKPEVRPNSETAALVDAKPKAPGDSPDAAKASYHKGVTFQSAGRYTEAAEAFSQTIKVDPNDAKAYARLAMAYTALHRDKDAIIVYKMAHQINASVLDAPAYYTWGHSYLALDKSSDALAAFKQALDIKRVEAVDPARKETPGYPSLEQLHYAMGIAYLNSRRFSNSIYELKEAVKLNPKMPESHYAIALAYLANGNRREAQVHQKTLSSLDPALAKKLESAFTVVEPPLGCRTVFCR
jgi:TonB family protein